MEELILGYLSYTLSKGLEPWIGGINYYPKMGVIFQKTASGNWALLDWSIPKGKGPGFLPIIKGVGTELLGKEGSLEGDGIHLLRYW